jgi:hypothetical protein
MSQAGWIPLTRSRRIVGDLLHFAQRVPAAIAERVVSLGPVLQARAALADRPCWYALLAWAYARVCREVPRLRRCYRSLPWAHAYQHEEVSVTLPIAREVDGEEGLLFLTIAGPDRLSLAEVHRRIAHAKAAPLEEVPDFRRQLRLAALPQPIRRLGWWLALEAVARWREKHLGTFGVTGVGSQGTDTPCFLTPLTTSVTMGVLGREGSVPLRMVYDHRILDAGQAGQALQRLGEVLRSEAVDEMHSLARPGRAAG